MGITSWTYSTALLFTKLTKAKALAKVLAKHLIILQT